MSTHTPAEVQSSGSCSPRRAGTRGGLCCGCGASAGEGSTSHLQPSDGGVGDAEGPEQMEGCLASAPFDTW